MWARAIKITLCALILAGTAYGEAGENRRILALDLGGPGEAAEPERLSVGSGSGIFILDLKPAGPSGRSTVPRAGSLLWTRCISADLMDFLSTLPTAAADVSGEWITGVSSAEASTCRSRPIP